MKRLIPLLIAALSLSSCLKEDTWCPTMNVSFKMEDEFIPGNFDSRVGHDVLLYIFQDDILTYSKLIPYDSLAGGTEYSIAKTPEILGNIKLVAWAVKNDVTDYHHDNVLLTIHNDRHQTYQKGSRFDQQLLTKSLLTADVDDLYAPVHHERYIGVLDPVENELWSRNSHHDVILNPAPGRIIVNITDPNGLIGSSPNVVVGGVMSQMNLNRKGVGEKARVNTSLGITDGKTRAATGTTHTTDIFGVLPSRAGDTLEVKIMNGEEEVGETLTVRSDDLLHQSIRSGDLLEFDYTINSGSFLIKVGPWEKRIMIVDM